MPESAFSETSVEPDGADSAAEVLRQEVLLQAGALQNAIFNSINFSSIATDARGAIQIFNVGAERMLGYTAAEAINRITPADISDPQELIVRARALSVELDTPITPGFETLVFKASRGIEDIYELTYIRKDGSRFPAVVSVTALRDAQGGVIGYLLIEGATLGGRIIGRHLQASLGLRADSGAAFFSGYGSATGPLWQAFGDLLRVRAASTDEAEIITGAVQTFDTLDRWLYPPAPMDTT